MKLSQTMEETIRFAVAGRVDGKPQTLKALETRGLIQSATERSTTGNTIRIYSLTDAGQAERARIMDEINAHSNRPSVLDTPAPVEPELTDWERDLLASHVGTAIDDMDASVPDIFSVDDVLESDDAPILALDFSAGRTVTVTLADNHMTIRNGSDARLRAAFWARGLGYRPVRGSAPKWHRDGTTATARMALAG
jgi:DNA-binding MarR family transcriptional regulator